MGTPMTRAHELAKVLDLWCYYARENEAECSPDCEDCKGTSLDLEKLALIEAALAAEREEARAERNKVIEEALDFADEAWSQISEYFRKKWDYEGQMAELRRAVATGGKSDVG